MKVNLGAIGDHPGQLINLAKREAQTNNKLALRFASEKAWLARVAVTFSTLCAIFEKCALPRRAGCRWTSEAAYRDNL